MPLRGILGLRSSQTSAAADDWAAVIFPAQGAVSFGNALTNALRRLDAAAVAAFDAGQGRLMVTTESAVKATLRALVPATAADCRPVSVYGQTAVQWTLYNDPWSYVGGSLATICLPQLSKRTVGGFVDKCLSFDPTSGFVVVDQDYGRVRVWSDFQGDASAGMASISPTGQTVCAQFDGFRTPLVFEGGPV